MKLKVCGMRDADNIRDLMDLSPDFMGMIFYDKSARFVKDKPMVDAASCSKVGVFVNATNVEMLNVTQAFGLDVLQLHGDEPLEQVKELRNQSVEVIKVFSVQDVLPLELMMAYEPYVDYFLFDTKTPKYGGSGVRFDWRILEGYTLDKPFFLSGGIDLEDISVIKKLRVKNLYAIDVNSRFELAPGLKDIEKIKALKERL